MSDSKGNPKIVFSDEVIRELSEECSSVEELDAIMDEITEGLLKAIDDGTLVDESTPLSEEEAVKVYSEMSNYSNNKLH